jgi:pimeloyl-ACP methyl ester carboxylesterase
MPVEKVFDTGEVLINFAEHGLAGPPLVLLHGATLHWQSFGEMIPTLEQNWHIYACDLRGHGKSGKASSGYRHQDFLPDTIAFVERHIREPVVLAGFSLGGAIALGVAAKRPDLVRSLILLDPPLGYIRDNGLAVAPGAHEWSVWLNQTFESALGYEEILARCREQVGNNDEAGAQGLAEMIANQDPQTVANLLSGRLLADYHPEDLFPRLDGPTLLVYGERSLGSVIDAEDVSLFRKLVPHGSAVQVPGVGHDVIWGPAAQVTLEHVVGFTASL